MTRDAGEGAARSLLALPSVATFLAREPQLREVVGYAIALLRYATGQASGEELDGYPLRALKDQVREWFAEPEEIVHLRDKAFLIALAAFDGGPYALTAELSDRLYEAFQRIGDPKRHVVIPVFSTHIGKRLELARAWMYPEEEDTEWGPVTQVKARFKDERAAMVVLPEVWTGHPAARPALVGWLAELANDGRPLVRTRAAATAAVLASTDLPSAMALIIEEWARSDQARRRTAAVSALTLAHRIGTPNIPRIIDGWSANADDPRPCWVAVRAHGLIGPERPVEALAALRRQARLQDGKPTPDSAVAKELPASVGLLLLSDRAETVLAELLRTLPEHRSARGLAVQGFLAACEQRDEEAGHGRPQIGDDGSPHPAVVTVQQLGRFGLSRRARTRIDHALVYVSAQGTYEPFMPPERPGTTRRFTAVYEVDTGVHPLRAEFALPSDNDAHEFEVSVELTWQVVNPARYVRSGCRDVPRLLSAELERAARPVGASPYRAAPPPRRPCSPRSGTANHSARTRACGPTGPSGCAATPPTPSTSGSSSKPGTGWNCRGTRPSGSPSTSTTSPRAACRPGPCTWRSIPRTPSWRWTACRRTSSTCWPRGSNRSRHCSARRGPRPTNCAPPGSSCSTRSTRRWLRAPAVRPPRRPPRIRLPATAAGRSRPPARRRVRDHPAHTGDPTGVPGSGGRPR
ncbi:hypothetical protein [Streptomyces lavendulae]|uniref:hypothetical protein n=1 Tax=Streptomyces lavendulae TaxID=1914 RepID=UPI00381B1D2A